MARHDPQVNFRLPELLLSNIKEEAQKQRRTVTAQLTLIIEEWFSNQKQNTEN